MNVVDESKMEKKQKKREGKEIEPHSQQFGSVRSRSHFINKMYWISTRKFLVLDF